MSCDHRAAAPACAETIPSIICTMHQLLVVIENGGLNHRHYCCLQSVKKELVFQGKKKKASTVSKHHAFALTPWRPLSLSSHSSVECYHIERRLYRCAPRPTGLKHRGMSLRIWANRTLGYAGSTHCSTVDVQGTLSTPLASPRGVPGHLQICWL